MLPLAVVKGPRRNLYPINTSITIDYYLNPI